MDYNERFGQIEALLADLLRRMDRQAEQMDRQSGQIDDIIGILKISDARQTRVEERQDAMLVRIEQQGERLDKLLQTQMKMLEMMSYNANRTDELERKFPILTAYEARFQRLEAAVFNKAS
ncbi:hypothetical protein [Hymenobacter sp. PAMC 26628]|uniref:hypothetical protein n=1 Tax=Hymenobacter sp. PAMC 26628 TaxID=1484118 RepID=UPI0007704A77|nr:hypothetical protein [Hymenobacter sp. PAMC 26628]AMJ64385.1 hypothetical protein AXW84_02300 [Hymenobacter sp. PAMC 26628]